MLPGSWSLRLRDETPPSVLDVLDLTTAAFGHIVITPAHVDVNGIDGWTVLVSLARYTGILRARPSQFGLAGVGLAAWLGDEDGKGDVLETALTKTAGTFVQWVTDLRPISLDAGTYNTVAGSLTHAFINISRRTALDYVADYFGAEWRITPAGALDAGTAAQLFVTNPTSIVQRRPGGRDLNINGITGQVETDRDMEDYTTRVVLLGDTATGSANISPATTYRDLNGNLVDWTRLIESHETKAGNENTVAQAQLNRFTAQRRAVKLRADAYDFGNDVEPGDTIYVYDTEVGLFDTANQVEYRGDVLFPMKLRVLGFTWPIKQGMGVYFRAPDTAGTLTDLTDWIDWETGTTEVEVGAKPRSSTTGSNVGQATPTFGTATVSGEVLASETTTSTSFVALATVHGVAFTAPSSGSVLVLYSAQLSNSGATATALTTPQVREGSTVGSGTVFYAATTDDMLQNVGTLALRMGASVLINGLTPGGAYNVEMLYRVSATTGTFLRRQVTVVPVS